jgi:hypothetical protein
MAMPPALPTVDSPEVNSNEPELPEADIPVFKPKSPLEAAELRVSIESWPLAQEEPTPLLTNTEPPVCVELSPEASVSLPPRVLPLSPGRKHTSDAVLEDELPEVTEISPDSTPPADPDAMSRTPLEPDGPATALATRMWPLALRPLPLDTTNTPAVFSLLPAAMLTLPA